MSAQVIGKQGRPGAGSASLGGAALNVFLVVILLYVIFPLVMIVVNSFSSSAYGEWPPPGFSTKWYAKLMTQDQLPPALLLSLSLAATSTAISLVVGTMAALALVRWPTRATAGVRAFLLSPLAVPRIAIGFAAFLFFLKVGLYKTFGGLLLGHCVLVMPYVVTIIGSGLLGTNRTLEEAARDLGATPLGAFLRVTVPQMTRSLLAAGVLAFMMSFDEFDATVLMANPAEPTLTVFMYVYLEKFSDPSMAALSTVLIGASFALAILVWLLISRGSAAKDIVPVGH